jgi:hypothetical protein
MGNPYKNDVKAGYKNDAVNFGDTKVDFFQIKKADTYAIDILPFTIATKNHPHVVSKDKEVGDKIHILDYWVHRNVGAKKVTITCPLATYGKPCPICEEFDKIKQAKGWDAPETKAAATSGLKPVRRVMYNVIDVDEEKETLRIFDVSWWLFCKELTETAEVRAHRSGKEWLDYAGVEKAEEALTIEFFTVSEKTNNGECWKFKSFNFLKRESSHKGITPIALDKYIILKSYDEIQQLFFMGEEEDHDQEEAVSGEAAAKDEAPTRRHSREEAEEPAPRRSRRTEEEAPAKGDPECPAGMTFGKDFDSDDKCDDCEVYSDCKVAFRKSKRGD